MFSKRSKSNKKWHVLFTLLALALGSSYFAPVHANEKVWTHAVGIGPATISTKWDDRRYRGTGKGTQNAAGIRLESRRSLSKQLAFHVAADFRGSNTTIGSDRAGYSGLLTTGFTLGRLDWPGESFLAVSLGAGLSRYKREEVSEGSNASPIEGGVGQGLAYRIAFGHILSPSLRLDIAFTSVYNGYPRNRNKDEIEAKSLMLGITWDTPW